MRSGPTLASECYLIFPRRYKTLFSKWMRQFVSWVWVFFSASTAIENSKIMIFIAHLSTHLNSVKIKVGGMRLHPLLFFPGGYRLLTSLNIKKETTSQPNYSFCKLLKWPPNKEWWNEMKKCPLVTQLYIKKVTNKEISPIPGIEPEPPGWKPGILATRPYGMNHVRILRIEVFTCWIKNFEQFMQRHAHLILNFRISLKFKSFEVLWCNWSALRTLNPVIRVQVSVEPS